MVTTTQELVYEAGCRVPSMSVEEAELAMSLGALLVDVREGEERDREGTIRGALHVPRGVLEFHADVRSPYYMAEFGPQSPIIIHCTNGSRSALAAETLQRLGFRDVCYLEGGIAAWKETNRRFEPGRSR